MLKILAMMYITLIPAIIAGIFVMLWCRLPVMKFAAKPVDGGMNLPDGRRIFGDNKTWKGIIGYVLFNSVFSVIWGYICSKTELASYNWFYSEHDFTFLYAVITGALVGLFYALFELPNSFLKRRLDIRPGKTVSGFWKVFFIFLDQADSVFGVALVVWFFHDIGILIYIAYVLVGAATHLIMNMLLYFMHLRKNMF